MPGSTKIEKAVQAEAELFTNLELKRNQALAILADETRLRSNVRMARGYLTKLESAISEYEQAVTVLLTSLETDIDQKAVYTNKQKEQLTLVDHILNQLVDVLRGLHSLLSSSLKRTGPRPQSRTHGYHQIS